MRTRQPSTSTTSLGCSTTTRGPGRPRPNTPRTVACDEPAKRGVNTPTTLKVGEPTCTLKTRRKATPRGCGSGLESGCLQIEQELGTHLDSILRVDRRPVDGVLRDRGNEPVVA